MQPMFTVLALVLACGLLESVQSAPMSVLLDSCNKVDSNKDMSLYSNEEDALECANGLLTTDAIWYFGMNAEVRELAYKIGRGFSLYGSNCKSPLTFQKIAECGAAKAVDNFKQLGEPLDEARRVCSSFTSKADAPRYMSAVNQLLESTEMASAAAAKKPVVDVSMTVHMFCRQLKQVK